MSIPDVRVMFCTIWKAAAECKFSGRKRPLFVKSGAKTFATLGLWQ
jgi:hypothetical protein